jgi:hypothetical protein
MRASTGPLDPSSLLSSTVMSAARRSSIAVEVAVGAAVGRELMLVWLEADVTLLDCSDAGLVGGAAVP